MKPYRHRAVVKVHETRQFLEEDAIAEEKRLRISVNGKEMLKLYCSPVMVRELVVGFFLTEGIIQGNWCIERLTIQYDHDILVDIPAEGEVSLDGGARTSGCGGGMTFEREPAAKILTDRTRIQKEHLRSVFHEFQKRSELYAITGCMHSAAVSDGKHLLVLAEDIGRHNAVDKVIGYCALEDIPLDDKIILVSGRLSSEMATKCARSGIPILVSRAAPTTLAVEIADKQGITLVGFMRGQRLNIYTHAERIIVNS